MRQAFEGERLYERLPSNAGNEMFGKKSGAYMPLTNHYFYYYLFTKTKL